MVDRGYADVELPFEPIACPSIAMTASWSLGQVIGYVRTWSAVSRYRAGAGVDPMPALESAIAPLWGDGRSRREVRWPLAIKAWRVGSE